MLVGAISVLAALYWYGRFREKTRGSIVLRLRRELRRLVHDPKVVDRLVSAERSRSPKDSEASILRKVMRRLKRDRAR
jgi:hypothetical protein